MSAESRKAFVSTALSAARAVVPASIPALGPVIVAQAVLESAYGEKPAAPFNYFGVKARAGEPFVVRDTTEYVGGKPVPQKAAFRSFDSMDDAFEMQVDLLSNRRFSSGKRIYERALQFPLDAISFARALTGVYATDPAYGEKLAAIMREHDLVKRWVVGAGAAGRAGSASPIVIYGDEGDGAAVLAGEVGGSWLWVAAAVLAVVGLFGLVRH